jgi:hypothetical protein
MVSPSQSSATPERRADLHLEHRSDRAVLVTAAEEEVGVLDATAAALWELCDGETSVDEIVDAVCSVWAVDRAIAVRDVELTLDRLAAEGFLEPSNR